MFKTNEHGYKTQSLIHFIRNRPQSSIVIKEEIIRIVNKNKKDIPADFTPFLSKVEEILYHFPEYDREWDNRIVFRLAKLQAINPIYEDTIYFENIPLPDVKHDLDLVLKMLNYMREQKGFAKVKMPLFIQPDELYHAYTQGQYGYEFKNIVSQLVVVFQKGLVDYVGFVFDFKFAILEAR
jgi:hypothetical protein